MSIHIAKNYYTANAAAQENILEILVDARDSS